MQFQSTGAQLRLAEPGLPCIVCQQGISVHEIACLPVTRLDLSTWQPPWLQKGKFS